MRITEKELKEYLEKLKSKYKIADNLIIRKRDMRVGGYALSTLSWDDKFAGDSKEKLYEKLEAFALGLEMGKNFKN